MDDAAFEELLHEEEGAALDFKREQYAFAGATDGDKSELLKDVLAFANAWRRSTAFILIGVEDVPGDRGRVVGVHAHLNDADLQQFVNSKTNLPVAFSYEAYRYEDLQVGIIAIPIQERPVFLTKPYGKLQAHTVYLRRGSSTAVADPAEVARMGATDSSFSAGIPSFAFEWANVERQTSLGTTVNVKSSVLSPRITSTDFQQALYPRGFPTVIPGFQGKDGRYYDDLIQFVCDSVFLNPLGFMIQNTGAVAAAHVIVKCRIEKCDGLVIRDRRGQPTRPSEFRYVWPEVSPVWKSFISGTAPAIHEYPTHWDMTVNVGHLPPKAKCWTEDVLWIGSTYETSLTLPCEIFAGNVPDPVKAPLSVHVEAMVRAMEPSDIPPDVAI